jgi:tetratricopeptide (TPR) repeat protein
MLSPSDIEHIKALLLSATSSNVALAAALLQEHPKAIDALLVPIEVVLTYSEHKTLLSKLLQKASPTVLWRQLPLYAFYNTIAEPKALPEHRSVIHRFIQHESDYRPYLLADPQKTLLYVDGATFISSETAFVGAAHDFYTLALEHLTEDSYLYYKYADFLRQHPPKGQPLKETKQLIIDYYKKAYRLKKEKHILNRLARFYADDLKDAAAARRTWKSCLQEHSDYADAWVSLAELEIAQQQWPAAKKMLEQVLTLQQTGVWVNLDQVYYLLGNIAWQGEQDLKLAGHYYEKALQENRYFAAPLEMLLELSLATENYAQAIRWHRVALDLQPMNIFLLMQLAELYRQTHNYEKAAEHYREILLFSPYYAPALEGLKQLEGF